MKLKKYKSQRSNDLNSKLKSYSALTGAFLLSASAAQSQVVFTDINPDTLLQNNSFDIDLDHDGIKDFGLQHYTSQTYQGVRRVALLPGVDPTNRPMAALTTLGFFSAYSPLNLPMGNPIGPGGPFYSFGLGGMNGMIMVNKWLQQGAGYSFHWSSRGAFLDSSGYIGVEFHSNGNTHYGWIHCAVDTSVKGVLIMGYAYNATPNSYIIGGAGNISSFAEQQSAISPAPFFYPNPASNGRTFIRIDAKQIVDLKIEILNSMGQVLQSEKRSLHSRKNIIELDVNSLATGTYFVKLMEGEKAYFRKIMVSK